MHVHLRTTVIRDTYSTYKSGREGDEHGSWQNSTLTQRRLGIGTGFDDVAAIALALPSAAVAVSQRASAYIHTYRPCADVKLTTLDILEGKGWCVRSPGNIAHLGIYQEKNPDSAASARNFWEGDMIA